MKLEILEVAQNELEDAIMFYELGTTRVGSAI